MINFLIYPNLRRKDGRGEISIKIFNHIELSKLVDVFNLANHQKPPL